jgi:hypothetical protein
VPRELFQEILRLIDGLRPRPAQPRIGQITRYYITIDKIRLYSFGALVLADACCAITLVVCAITLVVYVARA